MRSPCPSCATTTRWRSGPPPTAPRSCGGPGWGGTLARWAADGCVVHHLICTDGSKGSWDPHEDPLALVTQRQDEQRAAAAALGAKGEVVFLGHTDGELESGLAEREQVARVIRELQPEVVFGHDPWRRYRLHPDQRNAGFLAVEGIVAARDPNFYPAQRVPHWRPSKLLLWEADAVDHVEDGTEFVDTKLAALLEHRSQLRSTRHIDIGGPDEDEQRDRFHRRVLERLATFGRTAGVPYAEGFKRIEDL